MRPVIARGFSAAELAAFDASRQSHGAFMVPAALRVLHAAAAVCGIGGLLLLLLLPRAPRPAAASAGIVLLALLLNAVITGGLSAPHDRYQARVIWLADAVCLIAWPALRRRVHACPAAVPTATPAASLAAPL